MINLETIIDSSQVKERIRTVQQRMGSIFELSWSEFQIAIDKNIQLNLRGKKLQTRTGMLRRGLSWATLQREGEGYKVVLESTQPQARIQELGGIIKAKPGKALAIPLDAVKTRGGVVRKSPREWKDTFISKGIIFQEKGKKIIPLFVLKKKVKIPSSKWFSSAVSTSEPILLQIMQAKMGEV